MVCIKSFTLITLASAVTAQKCKLQFDGRIPSGTALKAFDAKNNFFNPQNVFGKGLSFSQLLQLPKEGASPFDGTKTVPIEVTISDKSIFNNQTGFRRAELLPASNDGKDASTTGVKTLHFSITKDAKKPLNVSHEYQMAFLESADFSTNQVVLKTGTILGGKNANPDTLQLFGNVNTKPEPPVLFSTAFTEGVTHNFGITLDFNKKTTKVHYSTGKDALKAQGDAVPNDVSGQGQYHFGLLKKPVGGEGDITKNGFQPAGITEGVIFSGIFLEDSADGCVSLAP
ncbi:hypothetical protein C8034_v011877 [Colletotrichum sidae]|uniref:Glycoside hydrolase 131 catalytic N-terminal domain-containing protein n=4 Tax=Colletotrichum orbiculare species complex TaxID=2707354 RepID=N4UMI2_COLOR|nr:hypothetical protein Cob_v007299 [Colletotrichum orbiculare MAFF 240422]TDZ32299.1 hypothetical protein C8035_v012370 [Colletotrichum spinosum]TDZ49687.1 hypothetical protein CTRI78_v007960 [Colletotrichum trifolii]TEA16701.1 hypothetical protein C8034_v011877 [Colletotrichum sidae]